MQVSDVFVIRTRATCHVLVDVHDVRPPSAVWFLGACGYVVPDS